VTPQLGDSVEILATSETMLGGISGLYGRVRALILLDDGRTVAVIRTAAGKNLTVPIDALGPFPLDAPAAR
jgi:hypothetical protein